MSSLVTFLLADAVGKGGPGSGPHGGNLTREQLAAIHTDAANFHYNQANKLSQRGMTDASKAHLQAWESHRNAAEKQTEWVPGDTKSRLFARTAAKEASSKAYAASKYANKITGEKK